MICSSYQERGRRHKYEAVIDAGPFFFKAVGFFLVLKKQGYMDIQTDYDIQSTLKWKCNIFGQNTKQI